jgi:hypothetical protein
LSTPEFVTKFIAPLLLCYDEFERKSSGKISTYNSKMGMTASTESKNCKRSQPFAKKTPARKPAFGKVLIDLESELQSIFKLACSTLAKYAAAHSGANGRKVTVGRAVRS